MVLEITSKVGGVSLKIHIIGGAGSGKSFLSRELSADLGIDSYELDNIFWDNAAQGFNKKATESIRDLELQKILTKDAWIIEGVYFRWLYQSFFDSDVIIVLVPNIWIQNYRLIKRFIRRKMGLEYSNKNETIRGLIALLRWNHGYNKHKLKILFEFISEFESKTIIVKSNDEAKKYFCGA